MMMVKRLLPIIMAGILVLETPVTAYAANSGEKWGGGQINALTTDAQLLETTEDGQEETSSSDTDADQPNQDEMIADEESSDGDENLSDEEKPDSDENSTEQEEPSTEESSDADVSDGDEENPSDEEQDGADGEEGIEEEPDAADDPEITEDIMPQKAAKAAAEGDFTYTTSETGATITAYTGTETEVVIPDTLGGNAVVAIGDSAFSKKTVTGVTIPSSVTEIGSMAFFQCTALAKIEIPDGVTTIGSSAFSGCITLAEVHLSKELKTVGRSAFDSCAALKTIEIPKNLTGISDSNVDGIFENSGLETVTFEEGTARVIPRLFQECKQLTTVSIPDTVTEIGEAAFSQCDSLVKIEIPDSVTKMGGNVFWNCPNLSDVTLSKGLETIGTGAFDRCTGLKTIEIPKSLTEITNSAVDGIFKDSGLETATFEEGTTRVIPRLFHQCANLNTVTMPDTVTEIGDYAFYNCGKLAHINLSKGLQTIGAYAFTNCAALAELEIPKSLQSVPKNEPAFGNSGLTTVTFEEGTTKIVDYLFQECGKLTTVTIPQTVTEIGVASFSKCTVLPSVEFPASVVTIGDRAFEYCNGLTSVVLPDSVITMGNYAFSDCANLAQVTLSHNVKEIGGSAFKNCAALKAIQIPKSLTSATNSFVDSGLERVTFEEGTTKIIDRLFENCAQINSVTIPDSVTEIGAQAFLNCHAIPSITIPGSVRIIGGSAFAGCYSIQELDLPDSVTTVNQYAFSNCTQLAKVRLSRNVTEIGKWAFYRCYGLTEIEIPKSLKSASDIFTECKNLKTITFEEGTEQIRDGLLQNCTGLEEIILPDTVTSIGSSAFQGCTGLTKIDMPNSVTMIGEYALSGCTALQTLELPEGVETIGGYAFEGCTALVKLGIPGSVVSLGEAACKGCSNLPSIELPNSVTTLGRSAFENCTKLTSVTLSENLEKIENNTFENSGLTAVTVPVSVKTIGSGAFCHCTALTEVNLTEGVTSIESSVFQDDSMLTKIMIPDSVTSLGSEIFSGCSKLADVTLGTGITKIPYQAFYQCTALEEIVLPYRVQTLESGAFALCTGLTTITIPRSVTAIEDTAIDYSYLAAKLTVRGVRGTYAEEWASERNVNFEVITIPAEEVKLNRTELSLYKRESAELLVSVKPMDFTDEVVWRSLDETVATVTNEGLVTAVSVGVAKIRVTVGEKELFCEVTVVQPVESIRLDKNNLELEAWETDMLIAEVSPADALNKDVAWSSSDEKIAVVDENGVVKGLMKGTAQIRATAVDGSNEYGSCTVTVINNGYLCTSVEELESPHDYLPDCTDFWVYTKEGAEKLEVAFDEMTKVEDGYDYIEIYDGGDKRIGRYTGTQLAGKTIEVAGNTVKIRLITDERGCMWGFKVASVFDPDGVLESDIPENGKIPEGMWIAGLAKGGYAYTGKAIKPDIRVYDGNRRLKVGTDYTVSYKNNTKANDATVARTAPTITVKGKGNYEKTVPFTFMINKIDLADSSVTATEILLAPNNKVQKAVPTVMFGGKKLGKGRDYDLAYLSAGDGAYKEPGIYDVQVTGKGNFTGAITVKLNITEKNLIAKAKVKKIPNKLYDNANKVDDYRVTLSETDLIVYMKSVNEPLKRGEDYDVTYENNDKVGTATAIITGKGNCIGTKRVTFKITGTAISKAAVSGMVATKVYNGEAQTQDIALTVAGTKLDEGTDYTVTYAKNRDVGKASVTIVGIGKYTGTIKKTFQITAYELKDSMIAPSGNGWKVKYVKGGCKPAVTLEFRDQNGRLIERLTEGVDYKLSYKNNSNIANASARKAPIITINGKGNFKGKLTQKFTIEPKALNDSREAVIMTVADVGAASGRGKYISKPVLTDVDGKALKANTDYTVEYRLGGADGTLLDNKSTVEVGKEVFVAVVGKGKYHGTLTGKYRVAKNKFQSLVIAIDPQEYTGREIKVAEKSVHVKVKKSDKNELTMGTHFEIVEDSYRNNVKKGTAKVTIRGLGDYGGEKTVTFKINTKKILFE